MPINLTLAITGLDEALSEAAQAIRKLKLGVSASVPIAPDISLAWAPLEDNKGPRRLHMRHGDRTYQGFEGASLKLREQAAKAVPALVEMLRAERAQRGAEIQTTADELLSWLGEMLDAEETD